MILGHQLAQDLIDLRMSGKLISLKEITTKIMAIITGARQLPPGHSHFSLTTQVWPNWPSISKVLAWEELGDHTFDLLVVSSPSVGPIPVDLPPSPVIAGPSTNPASKSQEKGKSAMKTRKWAKITGLAKFKVFVESEDEEDSVTQPISHGVPEVVLPRLSPDVARTSGSPQSPWSPKKKPFRPATAIAGKCPEVIEPPQATLEPPACHEMEWPCATWFDKRTGTPCMTCVYCTTKKIKCISVSMGTPPKRIRGQSVTRTTRRTRSRTPSKAPSKAPAASQITGRMQSQSQVSSVTPGPSRAQTPKAQTCGRSKTVTAAKEPTPAPAPVPSSTSGVPRLALDVPMLDLHAMAMAILEGAARIAALEERVVEQDAKIDTLQCLHEGLRHEIILRHPAFPLLDTQGDATSFLLHQPVPPAMSTPASALPALIDLSIEGMEPNPLNLQDESAINGLIFELNQIHPEVSQTPSEIVKPDDLGNLFPEYDSVEEMDVQVKGEPSGEDVDMTT
ncbi:uncharacterized protein EDB93DRAFT_1108046 [Suillus bovinus]|uniref:uncharacterized protein n=1 Tax=Suillus bovinus TaxID=48563 RepID=UPI001B8649D1|nr:uncharacterized protein EDB93DRAFT_1108046 [Suillus bovinus]KAG2131727.1 hypothetical protein EDB93DRAFT_1108046 [Suillus bovinus]